MVGGFRILVCFIFYFFLLEGMTRSQQVPGANAAPTTIPTLGDLLQIVENVVVNLAHVNNSSHLPRCLKTLSATTILTFNNPSVSQHDLLWEASIDTYPTAMDLCMLLNQMVPPLSSFQPLNLPPLS